MVSRGFVLDGAGSCGVNMLFISKQSHSNLPLAGPSRIICLTPLAWWRTRSCCCGRPGGSAPERKMKKNQTRRECWKSLVGRPDASSQLTHLRGVCVCVCVMHWDPFTSLRRSVSGSTFTLRQVGVQIQPETSWFS